ncbi:MAG: hypothetical protein HC840_30450 [Leptolyngbyaceae cyanobacterium RM2_2_4]|nr:hypothetical protein [bacterium]NJO52997.1 hypothetical protein [Leptolyngbyaceae cyanobacterium RM2_2_4]
MPTENTQVAALTDNLSSPTPSSPDTEISLTQATNLIVPVQRLVSWLTHRPDMANLDFATHKLDSNYRPRQPYPGCF